MKEKMRDHVPAIGGSSLLVIFAVLCLCVFSLLSLSTVLAQKRLADASAQAAVDYYEADLQAETVFARLRAGEQVAGVRTEGDLYRYSCPVTDNQTLEVELEQTAGAWQVRRWQVVAQSPPLSETLPVWDGK